MIKGAILLFSCCACLAAQDAGIEGVTIDSSTGRPIAGVHVRIFTLGGQSQIRAYGAVSDREGHFSIARTPPGSYFVMGERSGYLPIRKGANGPPLGISVKAGEPLKDLRVELAPRGSVSGRVVDDAGDPVQFAQVQLKPVQPEAAVAFSLTGDMVQTDDRGEYRIPAGPGSYHVQVMVYSSSRPSEIRTDGTAPAIYATTYYPSSAALDRAVPVNVAAGADVRGIEIRLTGPRSAAAAEGVVTGFVEGIRQATVYLEFAETAGRFGYSNTSTTEGPFRFPNLRPGSYRMFARASSGNRTLQSQIVEFPDSSPPAGVELRLMAGAEVSGSIAISGKRTIRFRPTSASALPPVSAETDAEGNFRIAGIFPGKYRVSIDPLPENAYVGSMDLDGTAAAGELDFSRGGARLKVAVGLEGARIAGALVDKDGARIDSALAMVLLSADRKQFAQTDEDHVARLGADGTYSFKALAPGKYWLLGIDVIRSGNITAESLEKLAALAEEVEVKAGQRVSKDVHVVNREDADAKAKQ